MLEELPAFAESLARELPYLLDSRRAVRDHETSAPERTQENPLGLYKLAPDRIRHLPEEEVEMRSARQRTRGRPATGRPTRTWA